MGKLSRRVVITADDVIENITHFLNTKRYESAKLYHVRLGVDAVYKQAFDPQGRPGFVLGPCWSGNNREPDGLFMCAEDAYLFWLTELLKSRFED